ncbi:NUDIX domain-containing protein [Bradyrhizobium sp. USDA 4486]
MTAQRRSPPGEARGVMVEMPAGSVNSGETIEQAARQECLKALQWLELHKHMLRSLFGE